MSFALVPQRWRPEIRVTPSATLKKAVFIRRVVTCHSRCGERLARLERRRRKVHNDVL